MTYQVLNSSCRWTARRRVATTLAQEILNSSETQSFPIASEHQLCRRFNVSRVTVRLALADLENRGLIYRQHGKGTFAHGSATRTHRSIAVLLPSPQMTEKRMMFDVIRGAHAMVTSVGSALVLTSTSPEKWSAELASTLGGVIVVAENATLNDLDSLKNRKLPYLILGETDLPGPRIRVDQEEETSSMSMSPFFIAGQRAAEVLIRASLTGISVNDVTVRSIPSRELRFNFGM
jgi:DNA-binding transcriptional regulator YhcF (GntR family)